MAKMQADLDTLQQVREVLASAMERGEDAAEALDRAGLLLFPDGVTQIRTNVIAQLGGLVDAVSVRQVHQYLQEREPTSPGDMKRQIAAWISGSVKQAMLR
jgi:hypothetical protein